MSHAINLAAKLASFGEKWSPRTVATFNGHDVMVVKVEGEFTWRSNSTGSDAVTVPGVDAMDAAYFYTSSGANSAGRKMTVSAVIGNHRFLHK